MCKGIRLLSLIAALCACTSVLADQPNLVRNPGFEVVTAEGEIEGWEIAGDCAGEMASVSKRGLLHSDWWGKVHSGGRAALIAPEEESAGPVRVVARYARATPGRRYGLAIWCKGSGTVKLGALQSFRKRRDKPSSQEDWQETPTALTDQWQKLTLET